MTSVSDRLVASRGRTHDRSQEVLLLLSMLTRSREWSKVSHLAPAIGATDNHAWRFAVCIHSEHGVMAWRLSDADAEALFPHLSSYDCESDRCTRKQKMERACVVVDAPLAWLRNHT